MPEMEHRRQALGPAVELLPSSAVESETTRLLFVTLFAAGDFRFAVRLAEGSHVGTFTGDDLRCAHLNSFWDKKIAPHFMRGHRESLEIQGHVESRST